MKELEKEYQNAISLELPYLWDRIEAGVDEYEAEKKATQKETQNETQNETRRELRSELQNELPNGLQKETTKSSVYLAEPAPLPDTKNTISKESAADGRGQKEKILYLIRRYAATAAGILVLIVGIGALGLSRKSQSTAPSESTSYEASDAAMSESATASDEAVEMADEYEADEDTADEMEDFQYAAPSEGEEAAPFKQPATSNAAASASAASESTASAASESTAESAMEEEDMAAEDRGKKEVDALLGEDIRAGVLSITPVGSLADIRDMGTNEADQIEEILRNEAGIHSPGEYGLIEEDPESSELPYGVTQETEYVRVWLRDASDEKAYIMTLVRDGDQKMSLLNVVKADAPSEAVYEAALQKEK
ncbi:MAG: hypothetical protein K6E18_00510 [Lachnospiraceae bacterium]|nr:hypothetical protein [Lachnospiraceae bacterium]